MNSSEKLVKQLTSPAPGVIITASGEFVDIFSPQSEQINIEDIAHALSNICRFGGHTRHFYSVAEHSVRCSLIVAKKHRLAALLHDASEAYLLDIPRPVKTYLKDYRKQEDLFMKLIAEKYNFKYPLDTEVTEADDVMLESEIHNIVLTSNWETLTPGHAKDTFIHLFNSLIKKAKR